MKSIPTKQLSRTVRYAGSIKKHAVNTVIGLNVAAVIFLYTHFVTIRDFDQQASSITKLQKDVVRLQAKIAFMQGQEHSEDMNVPVALPAPTVPAAASVITVPVSPWPKSSRH